MTRQVAEPLSHSRQEPSSLFTGAFVLSAAAALLPLWSVKYPPMVDLPQHAAVVFLLQHFFDPAYGFHEIFELDLFSPYLFGHALGRLFAAAMPVPAAMKAVVSLALVALPAAMLHLFRRAGSDVWGALLGFPLAYGFAFYWGFTNYLLAVPVGLAFVAAGLGYARAPSRTHGLALALFAFVLYFCHALAFALCVPIVGLWVLSLADGGRKQALLRLWPLVPAAVVIGVWVLWLRLTDPNAAVPLVWSEAPWERLLLLPKMLVGAGRGGSYRSPRRFSSLSRRPTAPSAPGSSTRVSPSSSPSSASWRWRRRPRPGGGGSGVSCSSPSCSAGRAF